MGANKMLFIMMMLPYNLLRQVKSDIIVEGVRKSLWTSVEVVVRAALRIEKF